MNKAIKRKWIRALRSGRYRQANSVLMDVHGAMCCLGVLGKIQGVPDELLSCKITCDLPPRKNALLTRANREVLSDMNDEGKSFKEIAAFIARHY